MKLERARLPIVSNWHLQSNHLGTYAKMKKTVQITIEGGVIQDIDCPEGVQVIVRDFDTDGIEPSSLGRSESGDEYLESVWD